MNNIEVSTKVTYTKPHGSYINGIVKSFNDTKDIAFVVYYCNDEWRQGFLLRRVGLSKRYESTNF